MTKADSLLARAYHELNLENMSPKQRYERVGDIVQWLKTRNSRRKIAVATTGTISERLCKLALDGYLGPDRYEALTDQSWKWLADFSVLGRPLNVLISVKSFSAKERLLMSGSGTGLAPTIGWGLFNDPKEWHRSRIATYVLRGFTSVYMPADLMTRLAPSVRRLNNANGRRFLRDLERFGPDLRKATRSDRIDPRLL